MIKSVTQHSYFEKETSTSRWVDFKTTHQLDGCTQNLHMLAHQIWLIPLVDDHQCANITKLKRKP
jgi:hypothetical protein